MFIIILKKVPFFYRPAGLGGKKSVEAKRSTRNPAYGTNYARMAFQDVSSEETEAAVPMSDTFHDETNIAFAEVKVAQEIGAGNYGKVNLGSKSQESVI